MTAGTGRTGRVLCVFGVSGGGKGTVITELTRRHPDIWFSVSVTTRAPRPGEVDGVHYHFVDDDTFDELLRSGGLVEWVSIYGNRYGTPKAPIEAALTEGRDVLLDVEVAGARFVKATWPDARIVFLVPPDAEVQRERLVGRGTTGADLERRLAEAEAQTAEARQFATLVVNDDLETTVDEVDGILFGSP